MEKYNLEDYVKGWFIGDFNPTLHKTDQFEVAIKRYFKGDKEDKHYHKIATEFTIVVLGKIKLNQEIFFTNDIIKINPKEWAQFEALEDSVTLVVKLPSLKNDKFNR
jgi:hypothetical protein